MKKSEIKEQFKQVKREFKQAMKVSPDDSSAIQKFTEATVSYIEAMAKHGPDRTENDKTISGHNSGSVNRGMSTIIGSSHDLRLYHDNEVTSLIVNSKKVDLLKTQTVPEMASLLQTSFPDYSISHQPSENCAFTERFHMETAGNTLEFSANHS